MITTRSGFEEAIRNKMPQRALVTFPALSAVFTNEDIAVNGGIQIEEILNGSENLEFGKAVESMANVTLINSDGLLSSVDFTGEFEIKIGVMLSDGISWGVPFVPSSSLAVLSGSDADIVLIEASQSDTRVYINGTGYEVGGYPHAMIMRDDMLYLLGSSGAILRAYRVSGATLTATPAPSRNLFMQNKTKKWASENKCVFIGSDGIMRESRVVNGQIEYDLWQYVPLGTFIGNKPDKVKTTIVSLNGYDLMQKFDIPAQGYFEGLTYPKTLGELFVDLCEYCGVEIGDASDALNWSKSFDSAPIDNDTSTCREVLAYIAEAAGCYARMSRNGRCDLVWFGAVDYTLGKTDYFSIDVAEYDVLKIDKLHSHVMENDIGVVVGDGENGYDIIDNPYLNEATEDAALPWLTPIYNRLAEFEEYSPITVSCESNWAICCGDVIVVDTDDGYKKLPIFVQTINWNGCARVYLQSTGSRKRGVMTAVNREKLVNGRQYLEVKKGVEGLEVEAVKQGGEFRSASVNITYEGIEMNTDKQGHISANVGDEVRLLIDENGVKSPLVTAEELRVLTEKGADKYTVIAKSIDVSEDLWKGDIQSSIDALPKYLTQDTTLVVPAGNYKENISINGFVGSTLTIHFSPGVAIVGSIEANHCTGVALTAATIGDVSIYPQSSITPVYVRYCQHALLKNLQISGYRKRTSGSGTGNGLYVLESNATVESCCVEYTRNNAIVFQRGTFDCTDCIGGYEGGDYSTNANLGNGVLAYRGAHGVLRGTCPISAGGNTGSNATLLTSSVTPTPGGMEYVEPTEFTKSFAISKHCTYVFGDKRIRDDQSTLISQGRYGTYETASHNTYWRLGAMWFADAASELADKTIKSAKLKLRRGAGGTSGSVDVYMYKVELTEASFNSTTQPAYPPTSLSKVATLSREGEATIDVTSLMDAVKAGYALCVYEPRKSYSGSYSTNYATFYGKGTIYEPVLNVTYE